MHLDWTALGEVATVSVGVTVAVVAVFAFGVLGLARLEGARDRRAAPPPSAARRPPCASSPARPWWRTGSI